MTDFTPSFLAADALGNPILLATGAPRTDKTGGSQVVATKSGNPFHDPGSGTFGNGPAGAKTDKKSGGLLANLIPEAATYLIQIRNKTQADTVSARMVGGKVEVTLVKDGKVVSVLKLATQSPTTGKAPEPQDPAAPTGQPDGNRDATVDEARSNKTIDKLSAPARQQRVDDLVDYLFARYNSTGAIFSKPGTVRVEAPSGWDQKTIAGMSDDELRQVSQRLTARGWSPEALQKILLVNVAAKRRNNLIPKAK